jgi:hypothetical protein
MKKILTFLMTALLAFGVGWAATYSHTFKSTDSWGTQIPQTVTLSSIDWTLDGTCPNGLYLGNIDSSKGKQFGSGTKPFTSLSLTTNGIAGTITSITVNASTANSASANLSVTVGGTSFINNQSLTTSATDYSGTGSASGAVVIEMTQTTSKALYIKSISITYTPGGSTPSADTPTFSPGDGTEFYGSQSVTISCATSGATIYYTTDGTTPTTSSSVYSAPISISETTTIKAIATANGYTTSSVASATYTKGTVAAPTFNPDGGTFTGSANVTITSATEGATIYYTTDGSDPVVSRSSIANGGTVTLTESCTLKAMASINGENSSIVTSQSFTINQSSGGSGNFQLLTDASVLQFGDEIIFVSEGVAGSAQAMSTTQNNNNRPGTSVTVLNDLTVAATATTEVFTLEGSSAGWYFKTHDNKYIYASSSSGNQLKTEDNYDDNAKATISLDNTSHEATVVFQGTNSRNNLRYNPNNGSPIYACYASTSSQAKPYIYYRSSSSTNPLLSAAPNPVYINDDNSSGGRTETFTVTGSHLGSGNVGVTRKHGFKPVLSATVGTATNHDVENDQYWYFTPDPNIEDGSLNGSVAVTYEGRALSATDTLTLANGNNVSTSVQVNYLYSGPIYVIGDVNNYYWNTNNGIQLTRDQNGLYSATVSIQQSSDAGYICFTRQLGSNIDDYKFGPESDGNWWYNDGLDGIYQPIDGVNANNIRIEPGIYTITVNPATNQFKIERYVLNVTIAPEDGTHFTGSTISGTITSEPSDATIEWSTDGTNWTTYTDGFTATVNNVGGSVTVYARATSNGVTANAQATYTRDAAPAPNAPSFSIGGSAVAAGTVVTITAPEGCTLYVDGEQVTNPYDVTINSNTTITAYCVNDEGTPSTTVTNTYTVAAVCNAVIEFDDNGTDASAAITASSIVDYYTAGSSYISSVADIARVYKGATGLKYGNSSNGGTITFNLASGTEWKVSHITLNAKNYNGNNVTFTVTTNDGQSETTSAIGSDLGGYTLDFDGTAITSITISASARAYLKGFTITYDCTPTIANPVITPASGHFTEDQEVTITCSTTGATIYYTVNGGETQTYSTPFTVDVDEEHTQATVVAWAVKGDLISEQVTATYIYYNGHVNSIAEFLELEKGKEAIFDNPVIVLFDYSQAHNSDYEPNGQEYIWVKDRTGYTQFFIQPAFDNTQGGFVPKYENGDVIPAGFKVKKGYYETGKFYQGQCYEWQDTFDDATEKALADPEQVTLTELLAHSANYNDRYLYINKLKVSNISGYNFSISTDEDGNGTAEVEGGTVVVGYNKYNSPAWKNKQGTIIGVTLPTDGEYYNVKFIFQKWSGGYEIMPIEFTPWEETSLRLEDLVEIGEVGHTYKISNQLKAAVVTWDDNQHKFAIFAKDDEMYANKRYPSSGMDSYLIEYMNQDSTFINDVPQENYDQSNWIEILIPSTISSKDNNDYTSVRDGFKAQFENKILATGSIIGTYIDALNPTIQMSTLPTVESSSTYAPNYYCTANFLMENLDANGAQSYRSDGLAGGSYFMMDAKPQEYCKVVWAYFEDNSNYFVAPEREGDQINGLRLRGSFLADMSLCEDQSVTAERSAQDVFDASNANQGPETLYGFRAIVRKNPNSTVWSSSNGAPHRIQPYGDGMETPQPAYIVYPLEGENSSESVTEVNEVVNGKTVESVRFYNLMGVESDQPFEGINIVVTCYTDGSRSTVKVLR